MSEGVQQRKQGISVYLGTWSGGQKKGLLETAAAFPVLCASCGGSTTHVLCLPLEGRDTEKEILKPCSSMWPQHGACKHVGTQKCVSHQERRFIALNLRLPVGHLKLGALRFPGESVRERCTSKQGSMPEVGQLAFSRNPMSWRGQQS